jgi:hypothetical protein
MKLTPNPLIVLGTFRGGTSCVASVVNKLGVFLGAEQEFQPASDINPGGFWELREIQDIHTRALNTLGMDYFRARKLPVDWAEMPGMSEIINEMRSLLKNKFSRKICWGWKEPTTAILLPLYKKVMADEGIDRPEYLIAVRHPLSVASSQRERFAKHGFYDEIEEGKEPPVETRTVGVWVHYTLNALYETIGSKRHVVIYEDLLADPTNEIERIAKHLMSGRPSAEQLAAANQVIKPDWSHSTFDQTDFERLPSIVGRTYDIARRAAADPEALNAGAFDEEIEKLYNLWSSAADLIRPIEHPDANIHVVWANAKGEQQRTTHRYTVTGGWQTVRMEIPAPPGTMIQIDPYQNPGRFWIRRAVWKIDERNIRVQLRPSTSGVIDKIGSLRLTILGPWPILAETPHIDAHPVLEIEFLVQADRTALRDMIRSLHGGLSAPTKANAGSSYAC